MDDKYIYILLYTRKSTLCKQLQYCCMYLLAGCMCTSSDSVYPNTAVMVNLLMYHDAVISERCSSFTMQVNS